MKRCPDCPNVNPRGSLRCVLCNAGVMGNHPEPENTWTILRRNPGRAFAAVVGVLVLCGILWLYGPEPREPTGAGEGIGQEGPTAAE